MPQPILHLIASNFVGGPEKQILFHAIDLRDFEYRVEIGSFQDSPRTPEILVEAVRRGLPALCISGVPRPSVIRELTAALRQRPGVLLCTHGFKANVMGHFAARAAGVPHIAFVRGWTAETWRVALYEKIERRILRRTRWVGCVARRQAEQLARNRSKDAPPPVVIHNAMLPPFAREGHRQQISRDSLQIPSDAFVFGSAGRLSAEKGHRFLLEAFHRLSARQAHLTPPHLILLGSGREESALQQQARTLGIHVHFPGFQKNCAEWMRLFDCMVLPSLTEGTPNAILEALCLQIPVIATAVGGVPDLIQNESNGLLVPAADADALAASMTRMMASPELRRRLVERTTSVREEYSPQQQRKKLLALYQAVLEDHGRLSVAGRTTKRAVIPAIFNPR